MASRAPALNHPFALFNAADTDAHATERRRGLPDMESAMSDTHRKFDAEACPACGHGGWLVGRTLAECAKCGHALPLENPNASARIVSTKRKGPK
jgi:pimeloyl-ACP methyl ester carboxylesterase